MSLTLFFVNEARVKLCHLAQESRGACSPMISMMISALFLKRVLSEYSQHFIKPEQAVSLHL